MTGKIFFHTGFNNFFWGGGDVEVVRRRKPGGNNEVPTWGRDLLALGYLT